MKKPNYSPSKFKRWGTCTASPVALLGFDSVRSSDADEGLIFHALCAICMVTGFDPYDFLTEKIEVRDVGPSDITIEMADYARESLEYVRDHIKPHWTVEVELCIDLDHVVPGQNGYADVVAYDPEKPFEIHCFDFKYGRGVQENAERNSEIMFHAIGVIDTHLPKNKRRFADAVVIHIVQPRLHHYDIWHTNKKELHEFAKHAHEKYIESQNENTWRFVPSVDGCKFCERKTVCRPLHESVLAKVVLTKNAFGDLELKEPSEMSEEELAELFPWLGFIAAWTKNVSEYMTDNARHGVHYKGMKLIKNRDGKREWKDQVKAAAMLEAQGLEDFEMYNQTLITAPQAEKVLGKKRFAEVTKELLTQEPGSTKLVLESDRGQTAKEALIAEFDD